MRIRPIIIIRRKTKKRKGGKAHTEKMEASPHTHTKRGKIRKKVTEKRKKSCKNKTQEIKEEKCEEGSTEGKRESTMRLGSH